MTNNKLIKFISFYMFFVLIYFILLEPKHLLVDYSDIFFTNSLLLITISIFIIDTLLIIIHEMAHFLSMRGLSGELGYIGIGRRLYHLVFETRLDNIWLLEKKDRIKVYSSGMFMDLFLLSTMYMVSYLTKNIYVYKLSRVTILLLLVGFIFEFKFYLRTDIYFIVSDLFNQPTLMKDTEEFINNIIFKKRYIRPNKVILLYSLFFIIGISMEFLLLIKFIIPITVNSINQTYNHFSTQNMDLFYTNIFTILLNLIEMILVIIIFIKEKHSNKTY